MRLDPQSMCSLILPILKFSAVLIGLGLHVNTTMAALIADAVPFAPGQGWIQAKRSNDELHYCYAELPNVYLISQLSPFDMV